MDQDRTFQKKNVMICCKKQILTLLNAHVWFIHMRFGRCEFCAGFLLSNGGRCKVGVAQIDA